jgi:deoxyribodipyrimidine photo-lyase
MPRCASCSSRLDAQPPAHGHRLFLTKDLGLDWRRGEAWFAEKLLDFDLAANNGGWQWAASTGCDAQPWFRIFNPVTQSEKFDAEGRFIRRYVPELDKVPQKFIHAPWTMSAAQQAACGVASATTIPHPWSTTPWRGRARWKGSRR